MTGSPGPRIFLFMNAARTARNLVTTSAAPARATLATGYAAEVRSAKAGAAAYNAGVEAEKARWVAAGRPWTRNAARRGWL